MAPGTFCVWSYADPDAGKQVADGEDKWLFTDHISSLPGVAQGVRLQVAGMQSTEPPYIHDISYLTMYEIPDISYTKEKEFKDMVEKCVFSEQDGVRPRVYEEVERIEAEDFKGDPIVGELVAVVTGEGPPPGTEDEFWRFHRDEFVAAFTEAPEFIRAQVFRMPESDVNPEVKKACPTGPVLVLYHWDCPEIPWSEVVAAAQTKGYYKYLESGIKWQMLNYHSTRFTTGRPARDFDDDDEEDLDDDEEEDDDDDYDEV
ncbi:hypothetical protein K504DRAFT_138498 [Pleomassaria siparia CBS 279.74]|uniref:Uncharacterized protein n=1 Tax=Pleomassaria siparia CBS 279.74 TaxID=1314801 RepID=A0A6G1KLH0_9PLEO|nr:hypothetical protein K504DRAFT_138498 [Pleomassaria siparia CBS 279.74]